MDVLFAFCSGDPKSLEPSAALIKVDQCSISSAPMSGMVQLYALVLEPRLACLLVS